MRVRALGAFGFRRLDFLSCAFRFLEFTDLGLWDLGSVGLRFTAP